MHAVKYGSKTIDKGHTIKSASGTHEAFTIKTLPEAMSLTVMLLLKKTLAKDKELGEAELDVWKHISPGSREAAETTLQVGDATVRLGLAWTSALASPSDPGTPSRLAPSATMSSTPGSIKSKPRFSLHRSRNRE